MRLLDRIIEEDEVLLEITEDDLIVLIHNPAESAGFAIPRHHARRVGEAIAKGQHP